MSLIRIINNTYNSLSLVGDEGKPYIQINARGNEINYVDIPLVDAVGNVLLCGTLSLWVTDNTVTVLRNGVEITSEQLDQQLLLIDDDDDDDSSTSDTTWIIDPEEGDDDGGTGLVTSPFKSFRCLDNLPKILEHEIKIKPKAGDYDYFPLLDYKAIGNGRLVIDASGETYPVVAGEYIIGSVSGVGDLYSGYYLATDITVSPSPSWTPNEYYPMYIHITSGNWAGYILPLFKHDVDTIRTGTDWYGFAPGDKFNIVRPPVRITVPDTISFNGNNKGFVEFRGGGVEYAPYTPTLLMAGIEFRTNNVTRLYEPFKIENICMVASFCTFMNEYWQGGNNVGVAIANNSAINYQQIPSTFDNSVLDDWYTYTLWLAMHENEPHHEAYPDLYLNNSVASCICCRGGIGTLKRISYISGGAIIYSMCGGIWKNGVGQFNANSIFTEHVDYPPASQVGPIIRINGDGYVSIDGLFIYNGDFALKINSGGYIHLWWLKGNISGDYAFEIDECSTVLLRDSSEVTVTGVEGNINFLFSNTQHAVYPNVGDEFVDGSGSRIISKG